MIFARRLRLFRLQASLTQQHLAGQMTAAGHKMLPSTISAIETGHGLVTIGEAVQVAAALGIPLLALATDGPPDDLIKARAGTWRLSPRRQSPGSAAPAPVTLLSCPMNGRCGPTDRWSAGWSRSTGAASGIPGSQSPKWLLTNGQSSGETIPTPGPCLLRSLATAAIKLPSYSIELPTSTSTSTGATVVIWRCQPLPTPD